jgi:GR25 family glycosyltransferase involved in LPS biosynthesis
MYFLLFIIIVIIIIIILAAIVANNNSTAPTTPPMTEFPFQTFIINLDRSPERYTYVTEQLKTMGITKYRRWRASDGKKISVNSMIKQGVNPWLAENEKGSAGCSLSHIRLWRYMVRKQLGWCLILEDDVNFHPDFMRLFPYYWNYVPSDAKIVYPGYCGSYDNSNNSPIDTPSPVFPVVNIAVDRIYNRAVLCTHAYMINWQGAQYLLDNLLPMTDTVDQCLLVHFKNHPGSYIFNGEIEIKGIRASDHKMICGGKCTQEGIVYQNREIHGSILQIINKND